MAGVSTKFEVLLPLEEWHLNLEVCSQVYQLLEGFKQLWKATLWPALCPYCTGEGFRIGFKKALPQDVTAPHWLRGFSSTPSE